MNESEWIRIRETFEEVASLPSDRRASILDERFAEEQTLRAEVESLLEADVAAEGFLERASAMECIRPDLIEDMGTRIGGRFELVRVLASGGMGTVYEALQEQPRRSVALKMMRRGLVSDDARRRFRFETETLARLHHPAIAQIFESGTHREGEVDYPYFAMELVEGARDLLSYARDRDLNTRQRIELFLEICAAVHHGHQRGVIHRDLKPGNVLVDTAGEPRLIDFGIARSVDGDGQLTRTGQVVGTLQYMSPELMGATPATVDTRTDVWALGCILHELLVGRPPHDLNGLSLGQAARVLAEREVARPTDLSPELGWVLLTALAREPERRYSTASELGADLRRFLRHEPVLAGPPSATYRLRKLLRRHRLFLGTVAAVLIALGIGLLRAGHEARAAQEALVVAQRETDKALGVASFLRKMLTSVGPLSHGDDARVRDVLETAAASIETEFADQPEARALVQNVIAESYLELRLFGPARKHLQQAIDYVEVESDEDDPLRIDVLVNRAALAFCMGRHDESKEIGLEAFRLARVRFGSLHERTLRVQGILGEALARLDELEEAERHYDGYIRALEEFYGPDHGEVIGARGGRAIVWRQQGDDARAEEEFETVLELAIDHMPEGHWRISNARLNLAGLYLDQGRFGEAETAYGGLADEIRATMREDHPFRMNASFGLAQALEAQDRHEEALEPYAVALEIAEKDMGADSDYAQFAHARLAGLLLALQRTEEARVHLAAILDQAKEDSQFFTWAQATWEALEEE